LAPFSNTFKMEVGIMVVFLRAIANGTLGRQVINVVPGNRVLVSRAFKKSLEEKLGPSFDVSCNFHEESGVRNEASAVTFAIIVDVVDPRRGSGEKGEVWTEEEAKDATKV
jgi:hypothetical protein